jgi:hypothetical protein
LEKSRLAALFSDHWLRLRLQKAWFLQPALARGYARAGGVCCIEVYRGICF